jgi:protease I
MTRKGDAHFVIVKTAGNWYRETDKRALINKRGRSMAEDKKEYDTDEVADKLADSIKKFAESGDKKVAVLVTDMFEDSEYTEPVNAIKEAGHGVTNIGLTAGSTVEGKKKGARAKIDQAVSDVSVDQFDALLIPGGYSPDRLRAYPEPVEFVREFVESGKPVFLICHAGQLLVTADVFKDRKVTGWKSIKQDLINAGAEFIDEEVVEDGNLTSSRSPSDLPAFIKTVLEKLK